MQRGEGNAHPYGWWRADDTRRVGLHQIPTVNARDLHAFLEVRKDFSDWIKGQLAGLFTQDIDFEVFPIKGENATRPRIEYALTLDAAKHVAMMARNEKGHKARKYFIACEARAKAIAPVPAALTQNEVLLQVVQGMVDNDRKHAETAAAVALAMTQQ